MDLINDTKQQLSALYASSINSSVVLVVIIIIVLLIRSSFGDRPVEESVFGILKAGTA